MYFIRKTCMFRCLIFICLTLYASLVLVAKTNAPASSINTNDQVILYFRFSKSQIEENYQSNKSELKRLDYLIQGVNKKCIDSIQIISSTSPDGSLSYNELLAKKRSNSIVNYLKWKYPEITFSKLSISERNYRWEDLKAQLEADNSTLYRDEILTVLNYTTNSDNIMSLLKKIDRGKGFNYLSEKYLNSLRNSTSIIFYKKTPGYVNQAEIVEPYFEKRDFQIDSYYKPPIQGSKEGEYTYPLAIKTNLLFDVATALNVELEIPIARQWSVAAEWIFPWWYLKKDKWSMHIMYGNLEARYWFDNNLRSDYYYKLKHKQRNSMQGWFMGVYAGGGIYDLLWKEEGVKGNVYLSTGLTGGYVLPLNRKMAIEFSLGVGYLRTNYERFVPKRNCLVWQRNESLKWFGPTRAKVSLIWKLSFKKK